MSVTTVERPSAAPVTGSPRDYLPAPALRIYNFLAEHGPSDLYRIEKGADIADGLAAHAWLSTLVDLGLVTTVAYSNPVAWHIEMPRSPQPGAPASYLPPPALRVYDFLTGRGAPATLGEVGRGTDTHGTLSWLLSLKDLGLVRTDTSGREIKWLAVAS